MWAFKTEKEAKEYAEKVFEQLTEDNKPGWKIRVWENCGWHSSLVKDVKDPNGRTAYHSICFEGYDGMFSVASSYTHPWVDECYFVDPNEPYDDVNRSIRAKQEIISEYIEKQTLLLRTL